MTHICVGNLTTIGSDNGLSSGRRQAIIWSNAKILLIGPLGTNFSEILMEILTFPLKKMRLKESSAKWRPFCLGLNVLSNDVLHCAEFMQHRFQHCVFRVQRLIELNLGRLSRELSDIMSRTKYIFYLCIKCKWICWLWNDFSISCFIVFCQ